MNEISKLIADELFGGYRPDTVPNNPETYSAVIYNEDLDRVSEAIRCLHGKPDEQVERVAKIIYERGMRYLRLDVPEWTEGGNSLAQDEARAAAHEIIAAMQPTPQDAAKVLLEILKPLTDADAYGKAHSLISYRNGYSRALADLRDLAKGEARHD